MAMKWAAIWYLIYNVYCTWIYKYIEASATSSFMYISNSVCHHVCWIARQSLITSTYCSWIYMYIGNTITPSTTSFNSLPIDLSGYIWQYLPAYVGHVKSADIECQVGNAVDATRSLCVSWAPSFLDGLGNRVYPLPRRTPVCAEWRVERVAQALSCQRMRVICDGDTRKRRMQQ